MLMLHLEQSWQGRRRRQLGPITGLRLVGRSVRILPMDLEVFRLLGDQWRDDDLAFDAIVIESPVVICGERSRGCRNSFGHYCFVRLAQGNIYVSRDLRQSIGCFNPFSNKWHLDRTHGDWPSLTLFQAVDPAH